VEIELSARIRPDQYFGFGVSGEQGRAKMIGSDLVVAFWNESTNTPYAVDYTVSDAAQCDGRKGVCPDSRVGGSNDATLSE
jgi:hypothetical protein